MTQRILGKEFARQAIIDAAAKQGQEFAVFNLQYKGSPDEMGLLSERIATFSYFLTQTDPLCEIDLLSQPMRPECIATMRIVGQKGIVEALQNIPKNLGLEAELTYQSPNSTPDYVQELTA